MACRTLKQCQHTIRHIRRPISILASSSNRSCHRAHYYYCVYLISTPSLIIIIGPLVPPTANTTDCGPIKIQWFDPERGGLGPTHKSAARALVVPCTIVLHPYRETAQLWKHTHGTLKTNLSRGSHLFYPGSVFFKNKSQWRHGRLD